MSRERLPDLYLEAVELDTAGRRALLADLEREDAALAADLERLLARPESSSSPIDGAPAAAAVRPDAFPTLAPPSQLGSFRIVRELGRGGMGRVFLAEQTTPDFRRTVALKLVACPAGDDEAIRRFRGEVRTLAALDHPSIARFLDGGQSPDGVWFLALEYVEGDDLLDHARRKNLDVDARVRMVLEVAEAVDFAHGRGVVHRDLKPANILVGRDGRPRLLDFGISKLVAPDAASPTATLTSRRLFTPAYASPEQLAGETVGAPSDIYSLGVVLYELLVGRRPEGGGDGTIPAPSRARRRTGGSGPATGAPGRIGAGLDEICLRALARDPAHRQASMAELAAELARYLGRRPAPRRSPLARLLRDGKRLARAAALVVALLALAFVALRARFAGKASNEGAALAPLVEPQAKIGFPFDPMNPPPVEKLAPLHAAAPHDVVVGAAVALRQVVDRKFDEAKATIATLRQIPGRARDPLIDYAEARIAHLEKEEQKALVLVRRAAVTAETQGRVELFAEIHGLTGSVLSALGRRDEAIVELERALRTSEAAHDALNIYRNSNDLAIEYLQKGDFERGRALLERGVAESAAAKVTPLVALQNICEIDLIEGRVELAEKEAREILRLRRAQPQPAPRREAQALLRLHEALREQGRAAEASAELDRAIELLRGIEAEPDLAVALKTRAADDLDAGRRDRLDAAVAEMDHVAAATLDRRALGHAKLVAARRAVAAGDLAAARRDFEASRQALRAQGDFDIAASGDLHWAEAELAAGDAAAAERIVHEALAEIEHPAATRAGLLAEALLVEIESRTGRVDAARRRLEAVEARAGTTPAVTFRLALLGARAAVEAASGHRQAAREALTGAAELAESSGRSGVASTLRARLARA